MNTIQFYDGSKRQFGSTTLFHLAAHEAGHATLGLLYGMPFGSQGVVISKKTGYSDCKSATWLNAPDNPHPMERRALRVALLNMAGLAAEIDAGHPDRAEAESGARGDIQQVVGCLGLIRLVPEAKWSLSPCGAQRIFSAIEEEALALVHRCSTVHASVTTALIQRSRVLPRWLEGLREHPELVALRAELLDGAREDDLLRRLREMAAAHRVTT